MATSPSAFYDEIRTNVPGAIDSIIDSNVIRAARQLCTEGLAHMVDIPITPTAGNRTYAVASPVANTNVILLFKQAKQNGLPVYQRKRQDLERIDANWAARTGAQCYGFMLDGPRSLIMYPYPASTDTGMQDLELRGCVAPVAAATDMDDDFAIDFREGIIAGALYFMLMTRDKPWTDYKLAQYFKDIFDQYIFKGRARVATDSGATVYAQPFRFYPNN